MDHHVAVESGAVERYTLRTMAPEEATAFELHFFGCESCARDLRVAAAFQANAREVLAEDRKAKAMESKAKAMEGNAKAMESKATEGKVQSLPPREGPGGAGRKRMPEWLSPLLAAGLTAMAFLGWQQFQGGEAVEFASMPATTLKSVVRGEAAPNKVVFPAGVDLQTLQFDVMWPNAAAGQAVRLRLEGANGNLVREIPSVLPPLGVPMQVLLHRKLVSQGDYRVQVLAPNGDKLMHCDFQAVLQ